MRLEYKLLLLASLLANFADNLIGPFYAVFVQRIGGTTLVLGYSATLFSISTGVMIILVGRVSDRLNKPLVTTFGYFLYGLGSLGYLGMSKVWHLFVLQILFGLATACLSAPLSALFSRYIQKGKEGLQWGLEGGGSRLVVGLAVLIGTMIVNYFGFQVLFLSMALLQIVAALASQALPQNSRRGMSQGEVNLRTATPAAAASYGRAMSVRCCFRLPKRHCAMSTLTAAEMIHTRLLVAINVILVCFWLNRSADCFLGLWTLNLSHPRRDGFIVFHLLFSLRSI